jgi:monoamine oxidase
MGFLIPLRGGSEVLVDAMLARITTRPETGKRVTALKIDHDQRKYPQVAVTVKHEQQPRVYDHVVSTMPFGCFRLVDTSGCEMPFELQRAIQCLQYGPSVKMAIRFTTRWWEEKHRGGASKTDRPTRVVVYPSYGIDTTAATMIVSYTWTQDALRNAAFIKGSEADEVLINSILSDLAQMHEVEYDWLRKQYQDHHAWSWDNSEFSAGA